MSLHLSKAYLTKRYHRDKKSIKEIAKECGVTERTVYNQLNKFGLMK